MSSPKSMLPVWSVSSHRISLTPHTQIRTAQRNRCKVSHSPQSYSAGTNEEIKSWQNLPLRYYLHFFAFLGAGELDPEDMLPGYCKHPTVIPYREYPCLLTYKY